MTRETLITLGLVVFGGGLLALGMKLTLLTANVVDWHDARGQAIDDPVRLVTIEMLFNETGRVLNTFLVSVIGWFWIDDIRALPPGTIVPLSDLALAIALGLLGMAALAVLQGLFGLFFRRRIIHASLQWREKLRNADL